MNTRIPCAYQYNTCTKVTTYMGSPKCHSSFTYTTAALYHSVKHGFPNPIPSYGIYLISIVTLSALLKGAVAL